MAGIPNLITFQSRRAARVTARVGEAQAFIGSGFIVFNGGKGFVITNEHVVSDAMKKHGTDVNLCASFPSPLLDHPIKKVVTNKLYDFAVLQIDVTSDDASPLVLSQPDMGSRAFRVGWSDATYVRREPAIVEGSVTLKGHYSEVTKMFTHGPCPGDLSIEAFIVSGLDCNEGASGSIVLDATGNIFGYVKGKSDSGDCLVIWAKHALEAVSQL